MEGSTLTRASCTVRDRFLLVKRTNQKYHDLNKKGSADVDVSVRMSSTHYHEGLPFNPPTLLQKLDSVGTTATRRRLQSYSTKPALLLRKYLAPTFGLQNDFKSVGLLSNIHSKGVAFRAEPAISRVFSPTYCRRRTVILSGRIA